MPINCAVGLFVLLLSLSLSTTRYLAVFHSRAIVVVVVVVVAVAYSFVNVGGCIHPPPPLHFSVLVVINIVISTSYPNVYTY